MTQITQHLFNSLGCVAKTAKGGVATSTKKTSNTSSFVAVIHDQAFSVAIAAESAKTVLVGTHLVIVLHRQVVFRLKAIASYFFSRRSVWSNVTTSGFPSTRLADARKARLFGSLHTELGNYQEAFALSARFVGDRWKRYARFQSFGVALFRRLIASFALRAKAVFGENLVLIKLAKRLFDLTRSTRFYHTSILSRNPYNTEAYC